MSRIRIINTNESEEWDSKIKELPLKDIFYTSKYHKLLEDTYNYKAELFLYEEGNNYVAYPYLKKKINDLPPFKKRTKELKEEFWDISTTEYGGPVIKGEDGSIFDRFLKNFEIYCKKNNIITEFCRLNPFIIPEKRIKKAKKIKKIYYIDLNCSEREIWKGLKKANRNSITKAKKESVQIKKIKNKKSIGEFYHLYIKTMKKRNARLTYYYPLKYFEDLFKYLGDDIQLLLAKYKNKTISASIFLSKYGITHYYLSGMDKKFSRLSPNNLLIYQSAILSKQKNNKVFNLGGGYNEGDGLSKFKSSFSKKSFYFYRYQKIHNESVYKKLNKISLKYTKNKKIKKDVLYFPKYRR